MKLFTVDRTGSLHEDQTVKLTTEDPYSSPYYEIPGLFVGVDLHEHLMNIFPDGLSMHGWNYLKHRHTFGTVPNFVHETVYLTEMNLEYVRRSFFNDQPSRFQSIFACNTVNDATIFRSNFGLPDNNIYEIECEQFRKFDMNLIFLGTQNITGSFLAHKYWSGESGKNPFWEYIVGLPIKVSKKVG
jgi:hypothetical protein